MQPNPPEPGKEPNQGIVECSLCHRAVFQKDVNTSGRCNECAGKREAQEAETQGEGETDAE